MTAERRGGQCERGLVDAPPSAQSLLEESLLEESLLEEELPEGGLAGEDLALPSLAGVGAGEDWPSPVLDFASDEGGEGFSPDSLLSAFFRDSDG